MQSQLIQKSLKPIAHIPFKQLHTPLIHFKGRRLPRIPLFINISLQMISHVEWKKNITCQRRGSAEKAPTLNPLLKRN